MTVSKTDSSVPRCASKLKRPQPGTSFACGIGAGMIQAGLFNPYDRALYLSVKHKRPFISLSNWKNPYLGFAQSVCGRAVQGGLFFPLEKTFQSVLIAGQNEHDGHGTVKMKRNRASDFLVGSAAGCVNATFLNPLTAIKYRTWGKSKNRGMMREARHMWRKAGITPFLHGLLPTVCRDVIFGGCYTLIRHHLQDSGQNPERLWASNMCAAAVATMASGPFNLARNMQYATGTTKERPSIVQVLGKLGRDMRERNSLVSRVSFLQNRLRIGWGTLRVATGVALGQQVFDTLFYIACNGFGT